MNYQKIEEKTLFRMGQVPYEADGIILQGELKAEHSLPLHD